MYYELRLNCIINYIFLQYIFRLFFLVLFTSDMTKPASVRMLLLENGLPKFFFRKGKWKNLILHFLLHEQWKQVDPACLKWKILLISGRWSLYKRIILSYGNTWHVLGKLCKELNMIISFFLVLSLFKDNKEKKGESTTILNVVFYLFLDYFRRGEWTTPYFC